MKLKKDINKKFPSINEYFKFYNYICNSPNKQINYPTYQYINFIKRFNSISDIFMNDLSNLKRNDIVIIFIYFSSYHMPYKYVDKLRISNPEKILEYFKIVDEDFWDACNKVLVNKQRHKLSIILKTIMYLGKNKFTEITLDDLKGLYESGYSYAIKRNGSAPTMIQNIMDKIRKRAMPTQITKFNNKKIIYTGSKKIMESIINQYLKDEYEKRGQQVSSPLYAITSFCKYIDEENISIKKLSDIDSQVWISYKNYVSNCELSGRTKQVRIDLMAKFFRWLQKNKIIDKEIVEYGERYRGGIQCKPRMLDNREHFKMILKAILQYKPKDDYEFVAHNYLKVITATGFRLRETKWLEMGCITNKRNEVGEVVLHIKDKTGVVNKTTSILPWGIEAIKALEKRFLETEGIELYNKKSKRYIKAIFQYKGKLISNDKIYRLLNKIIDGLEFEDEYGNNVEYKNIKLHSFRHQKFNDVFDITNGNIVSVKMDSNHISTAMARVYTQQSEKKKNLEILKAINEKQIVGKSAHILKELLKTNLPQDKYVDTVKKMNISAMNDFEKNRNIHRYLGFGFCTGKCKKINKFCESCDYFCSSSDYVEELKDRYAKNFMIIKSRVSIENNTIYLLKEDRELIESLKYQEKWLLELGIEKEEINKLKIKFIN